MKTRNPKFILQTNKSFTLIEMLAVCAIIAILAGILYPALRSIREGPKKAQARADIRKIKLGIQNYYNEYGKWPPSPNNAGGVGAMEFYGMMNGNRKPYDGANVGTSYTNNNPRSIRFIELDKKQVNSDNEFLDPWGKPYWICVDNGDAGFGDKGNSGASGFPIKDNWGDYYDWNGGSKAKANDGYVRWRDKTNNTLKTSIAVFSWGPNQTGDDAKGPEYDDIASWY